MRTFRNALSIFILSILILTGCDLLLKSPEGSNSTGTLSDIEWLSKGPIISTPENETTFFITVNGNTPSFTEEERTTASFKQNAPLDSLGRVGIALSSMNYSDMPDFERESLDTNPTGWKQNRYDASLVSGGWLYNRAHLRGFQLMGDQDDPKNLMTGTRAFNVDGMLPFENMTADHMKENRDHHIMYRITPIFVDNNLLAHGVIMESDCIECNEEADYAVFVFNFQPGITIDYRTGDNWVNGDENIPAV